MQIDHELPDHELPDRAFDVRERIPVRLLRALTPEQRVRLEVKRALGLQSLALEPRERMALHAREPEGQR